MAASPSPVRQRFPDPLAPTLSSLTDDLLAVILIRLPTLADLGRACTVSVAFHRVISGRPFLRRLRALHPLPLLGIMSASFIPAQLPHPCAKLARAITPAAAADFWCHFVPSPDRWHHCDFRDGRALLAAVPEGSGSRPGDFDPRALIREFAVCDPLHRGYRLLPAIPDDLAALVHQLDIAWFSAFLAPYDPDEGGTLFRVICLAECETKLLYFIFSSVGGSWHAGEFDDWRPLISGSANPSSGFVPELCTRSYAHGCFCWLMQRSHKLLMLNTRTMEFSFVDIPQCNPTIQRTIVEAEGGKFGMFALCCDLESEKYALLSNVLQYGDNNATQWLMEAFIPLLLNYRYNITDVAGGYLLLQGIPEDLHSFPASERPNIDYFSLNLKTFQVDWFCGTRLIIICAPLYAGFPPSLSPPTI